MSVAIRRRACRIRWFLDFPTVPGDTYSMKNNSEKNKTGIGAYTLPFCNRVRELEALGKWAGEGPRLAVIHGRRRLGKSRLLRHWGQRVDCCYVLATEGTAASQRAAFAEDIAPVVPNFGEVAYPSWRALLRALLAQWPAGDRRCILVIDELPYLVQSSPELPSLLQSLVDDASAAHLPLVLCGSSQRMMQGLVLDRSAPLYGRAQVLLRLQPLAASELGPVLGIREPRRIVEAYAAWGGVPRYWDLAARQGGPLWECIAALVLSPSGVLHEEGARVLRDEEAALLERTACQAIGRGAHRPSELSGLLGVPSTTLAKPLRHLVELGLVRRDAPYDPAKGRPNEASRSSLYALADPFLSMWYRCVHPYLSGLELGAPAALSHAREAWGHHVAAVWEDLVRSHWHGLGMDGREWEAAGRYWEGRGKTGMEWDAVSVTSDRRHAMVGESKWRETVSERDLSRLVREMRSRPRPAALAGRAVREVIFLPSRGEFPAEWEGVRLVDASDLLENAGRTWR
jgi:AAA+ ATPase superfamily predicted ATPase